MTTIKVTEEYVSYQKALLANIYNWKEKAACNKLYDKEDFFDNKDSALNNLSRKYCQKCPVWKECLYTSLVNQELYGLWGALTPKQRKLYFSYILKEAAKRNINFKYWSSELNNVFVEYSDPKKVSEYFNFSI